MLHGALSPGLHWQTWLPREQVGQWLESPAPGVGGHGYLIGTV